MNTHSRNGKNRWMQFIHDLLNRIFDFINLGGEFPNELNGMLQLQGFSRHDRTDGSSGCISNLDSLVFSVMTLGRCCKEVRQLGEMNFGNLLCAGIFAEKRVDRSNMESRNK